MKRLQRSLVGALGLALLLPFGSAHAQGIAEQVARVGDGVVRMSFPSRPGVCGSGSGIAIRDPRTGDGTNLIRWSFPGGGRDGDLVCEPGPVRVELRVAGGQVTGMRTTVGGGDEPAGRDLGMVSPAAAVEYLMALAAQAPGEVGKEAVVAAVLAEGAPVHPQLLRLAARPEAAAKTRKQAVFWAGQTGAPVGDLARLYAAASEPEVQEQVIFAYSQRRDPEAVRELLRIARADGDVRLRKKAVFWLGQAAGREATRELGGMVEEQGVPTEVKEHAIFALSQRPRDEAVPALIRIARENPNPRLRKRAMFWLGETGDPRAVAFFEEILRH
ncbi:MAG TPA: HEAT repeat domain-containing protein [Longimicrobiaceae bacterium]|nr:HEAT repeat domain-containing protein [Longimicrobiaceae bacterium]